MKLRSCASFLIAALPLLLVGCKPKEQVVILQREWVANAEFAGDVWAARLAQADGVKLEVREGSEVIDPVKMVRSHAAQFGLASSDRILKENMQGADLVILGVSSYRSPVVFLSQPGFQMTKPSEFKNRKVGIQAGTNTELVFKSLISTVPLTTSQMTVVDSGWGINSFETKDLDVMAAFAYDEPVQLTLKGYSYQTLDPEQFGVHFVGTVYFTSKDEIKNHPETVQIFMNYLVSGWQQAIAHPDEAVGLVSAAFKDVDQKKELLSLKLGIPYFRGEDGKLLYASPERWIAMSKELEALGQLKAFSMDANIDYSFLDKALRSAKH